MAAREALVPRSHRNGSPVSAQRIRVSVSDVIEHYSIHRAIAWVHLGENNFSRVLVDNCFEFVKPSWEDVSKWIERERGHYVFAYVVYVGDSRTMRIEDIDGIANVLRSGNGKLYVDKSHGGRLRFHRNIDINSRKGVAHI